MPKKSKKPAAKKDDAEKSSGGDAGWEESDRNVKKKQQRKEDQSKKREENLARKAEAKKLLEEETTRIGIEIPQRVTRSQIKANLQGLEKKGPKKTMEQNVNRMSGDEVGARSVDAAISVLQGEEKVDKHPEKRRRAAFGAFEKRRIEELRKQKPELKLSQIKEAVFKEWQKSDENPMNSAISNI